MKYLGEGKERKQVVCFVVVQKTEGGGWISPSTHILKSGLLCCSETQKSGSYSGYNHAGYISPNIKQNCFLTAKSKRRGPKSDKVVVVLGTSFQKS